MGRGTLRRLLRKEDVILRRYEMVRARLVEGRKVLAICRDFDVALPTLYYWIHRFETGGIAALADRSHAPHRTNRTPAAVEEAVVALRREDSWRSAPAIAAALKGKGVAIHPRVVQRILKRRGLPRFRAGEKTPARPPSRSSPRPRKRRRRRRG